MTRFITIPLYLSIMLFLIVPGLLVILEMASRLFLESRILGVFSLVPGLYLGIYLCSKILSFRREDLESMREFVMVFLVYFIIITIGKIVSDNTLHIDQVLRRYKGTFKTYMNIWEKGSQGFDHTSSEAYFYSGIDGLARKMAAQASIKDFVTNASAQYYQDLESWMLYLGVNEVMSLYRVMLEEFEVIDTDSELWDADTEDIDDLDEILATDAQKIIDDRKGGHAQLTVFFTACLMSFDQKVKVMKNLNGSLVNVVRLSPSQFIHLQNFMWNENLNLILTWYMQEQILQQRHGVYFWVPLYLPVHRTDPPQPYGKFCDF